MATEAGIGFQVSPSLTRPMGPPTAASGTIWPIRKPWEPPENRPSVIRAQEFPRPAPMRAEEGLSISFSVSHLPYIECIKGGMGGRTRHTGTTLRSSVTDNHHGLILLLNLIALQGSNEVILLVKHTRLTGEGSTLLTRNLTNTTTRRQRPTQDLNMPRLLDGAGHGLDDLLVVGKSGTFSRFLASVSPVTVMPEPSITPSLSRNLSRDGVPPMLCRSAMTYLPEGFRSARKECDPRRIGSLQCRA